ncbi:hypothetical protein GUJ93_ZPchr0013g36176 [Zizania palustris]|uniref:Uncharacterized protein n=1 Tax=Zizania palustris TaxID=103762 RepID=A0A8J5WVU9_ZIZPA|nr:hypothetical protein GUJ93_ZPchr0013g36176 [Zizania palustris]
MVTSSTGDTSYYRGEHKPNTAGSAKQDRPKETDTAPTGSTTLKRSTSPSPSSSTGPDCCSSNRFLQSPTLMRLSHCGPPLCYIPCFPKSKDAGSDAVSAAPCPAADEDKPLQKIEAAAVAEKGDDDSKEEEDDGGEKAAVAALPPAPPKSNLKKADCADSECVAKGNVKWLDLLGKDLTEVKEFEPSESGDSLDDEDDIPACVCVIQ